MPSSRLGLNLQLGRQVPIPQNGLCFHPKNTANTHTSGLESSCSDLGSPEGRRFSSEGKWEDTSAEGCLMGTGVESFWEGCRQNHPEPELRARLVLSPLPRALISMLGLSSAWRPRQRGDQAAHESALSSVGASGHVGHQPKPHPGSVL